MVQNVMGHWTILRGAGFGLLLIPASSPRQV